MKISTTQALMIKLAKLSVRLSIEGEDLRYTSPRKLPHDVVEEIRASKNDLIEITKNKSYQPQKLRLSPQADVVQSSTGGVGTEIKKILARFGITATPNCSCNRNAKLADQWGPDECEKRADEIIGWMRAEATKRRLPFFDPVGRMILRRAIRAARKN